MKFQEFIKSLAFPLVKFIGQRYLQSVVYARELNKQKNGNTLSWNK